MITIHKTMPSKTELERAKNRGRVDFSIGTNVVARVFDKDGNLTQLDEGHNAITNSVLPTNYNGFVWILERLFPQGASNYDTSDGSGSDADIDKMELGTGTVSNSGLQTPVSPSTEITISPANTNLDKSDEDAPFMTLSGIWDSSFPAFSALTEAVLMTHTSNDIIAIKTLASLSKDTSGTLQIDWKFTISSV
jgi:hypothetical protein